MGVLSVRTRFLDDDPSCWRWGDAGSVIEVMTEKGQFLAVKIVVINSGTSQVSSGCSVGPVQTPGSNVSAAQAQVCMRCLDAGLASKQGVSLVAPQVTATAAASAAAVSDKLSASRVWSVHSFSPTFVLYFKAWSVWFLPDFFS